MDNIELFVLDHNLLDGSAIPTSAEVIPRHGIVYKTRPETGGAVHAHAPRVRHSLLPEWPIYDS